MDFRYAVCPANLHAHDLSFSQQLISRLFTDAQSRTHFLDIHNIGGIAEHTLRFQPVRSGSDESHIGSSDPNARRNMQQMSLKKKSLQVVCLFHTVILLLSARAFFPEKSIS